MIAPTKRPTFQGHGPFPLPPSAPQPTILCEGDRGMGQDTWHPQIRLEKTESQVAQVAWEWLAGGTLMARLLNRLLGGEKA